MGAGRIGVDAGGTFTDGVAGSGARRRAVKVPSTPDAPGRAVQEALGRLGGLAKGGRLHHGSTVGTNAVLTGEGARVVLVTTRGFEDVLQIARGTRADLHALMPARVAPLVPSDRVIGLDERMGVDGRPVLVPGDAAVARAAAQVARAEPEAVAISFLHAAREPRHERRMKAALKRALAGRGVSIHASSEVSADPREAERAATTVLDAFVGPAVVSYVRSLARRLPTGALTVMRSDGGRMTVAEVRRAPVRTLLSGPAAGVAAAHVTARRLGLDRALSFDVGGTSTDVAWIEHGDMSVRETLRVGDHRASVPSLALETVGAGGGSVVWLDDGGALRVGPRSAGAVPGPACYGGGGPFALTDAWLLLGRLPDNLLGGAFPVDRARAERAGKKIARQAGVSLRRLAAGAVEVASLATARALRRASVAEGHDPRGAHLIAFGGAGPTLAAETADQLELASVVVPEDPGAFAAWGTLLAPLRADRSRVAGRQDDESLVRLRDVLERDVRARLAGQGATRPRFLAEIDARYDGQAFEVTVPYGPRWRQGFHRRHAARFGFSDPSRRVEAVRMRVRGAGFEGAAPRFASARSRPARRHRAPPYVTRGGVHFHHRDELRPGARVVGPAVVEESTATTWVPGGWQLRRLDDGALLLEHEG